MARKNRDSFNEKNRDFRLKPNEFDTKRIVDTMKYINCPSRPTFLKMCIELGVKHYGPPDKL
jgi:hypothetical protein